MTCFVNLLSWAAVKAPDYSSAQPSLPVAGGVQTPAMGSSVFSVCLHPRYIYNNIYYLHCIHYRTARSVLAELQGDTELDNVVQLVFSYLQLQHPGLVLQPTYRYAVQYSTLQYSIVQQRRYRYTVQYSTVQYSTVQYSTGINVS